MFPFDDLPRTPPLVLVTVLAMTLGGAAVAGPPDDERWAAAAHDLQTPLAVDAERVTVTALGSAPTEAAAVASARESAWWTALGPTLAAEPELAFALDVTAAKDPPPFVEMYRVVRPGGVGTVEVVVRFTLSRADFDRLVARVGHVVTLPDEGAVATDLAGRVVVVRDGLGLRPSDVLLEAGGRPVRTPADAAATVRAGASVKVLRGGAPLSFVLATARPLYELSGPAPTCGPCCHGHCDDDELRYPK